MWKSRRFNIQYGLHTVRWASRKHRAITIYLFDFPHIHTYLSYCL